MPTLHIPLAKIESEQIRQVVTDFCQMLHWRECDYEEYSLFNFLEVVMNQKPEHISLDYLALPLVLDRRMDQLGDHDFLQVCRELKNGDVLEHHSAKSLLAFLKTHFAGLGITGKQPTLPAGLDIETRTILQRRRNIS
jgi:hypothetical protein